MEYRYLGNSGLKVSVLSLGGWLNFDSDKEHDKNAEIMKAAYEAGINFFDNAEVYGNGASEISMGKTIKANNWPRESLVVSTKIYWGGSAGVNDRGLSRKHIVEGLRRSLKRLDLEYVDLVFAHRPDDETPMEEIVRAFNWCIDQGLAFYWGCSEWSAEQIMDAHRVAEKLNLVGPLMEQPQYNMFHRERFEKEYEPLYRKFKLGTTIWSPLASGILTGKYVGGIPKGSRLDRDHFICKSYKEKLLAEEGLVKTEKVKKMMVIADELGCTMGQMALAWCIANPNVSTVITGASSVAQFKENLKALEVVKKMNKDVMDRLDVILENKPQLPNARF